MDLEPQQKVHHRARKVKVNLAMYCFYQYFLRYRIWKVDVALSSIVEDEKWETSKASISTNKASQKVKLGFIFFKGRVF